MDTSNPTARALIADVLGAPNPGERMMQLHHNGMNAGLSRNGLHRDLGLAGARTAPSRGGGNGGGRRMPESSDIADAEGGWGNPSTEDRIANSVWD